MTTNHSTNSPHLGGQPDEFSTGPQASSTVTELTSQLIDDVISEDDLAKLQKHLTESAEARREYLLQMELHHGLQEYFGGPQKSESKANEQ